MNGTYLPKRRIRYAITALALSLWLKLPIVYRDPPTPTTHMYTHINMTAKSIRLLKPGRRPGQ